MSVGGKRTLVLHSGRVGDVEVSPASFCLFWPTSQFFDCDRFTAPFAISAYGAEEVAACRQLFKTSYCGGLNISARNHQRYDVRFVTTFALGQLLHLKE